MKRTHLKVAALCGPLVLAACDSSPAPAAADITAATGTNTVQFAINNMFMPTDKYQYSGDLDGDGKPDNALSNIIALVNAANIDSQTSVTASFASGLVSILFEAQTTDAALQNASATGVTYYSGKKPANPPKYDGTDNLTVDPAIASAEFFGNIAGGAFSSNASATTTHPVSLQLKLALVPNQDPVVLPMNGVHLGFTTADGKVGSTCTYSTKDTNLPCGSISGSVKITDLAGQVLPAVSTALTAQMMADPNGPRTKTIEMMFDTGGCTDANGVAAKPMDLTVTPCELAGSSTIGTLLAPDVKVYDGGNYKPTPNAAPADKDSLSVGLGFTAVPVKITK